MGLQLALWKFEAKLIGILLLEALVPSVMLAVLVAEGAGAYVYLFRATADVFLRVFSIGSAICFGLVLCYNLWPRVEICRDEPLREPLCAHPELEREVQELATDLRVPSPQSVAFLLSPVRWRTSGNTPSVPEHQQIWIPVSLLGTWSVQSLRCQIAHALVRRSPKRWLFYAVRNSMLRLSRERASGLAPKPNQIRSPKMLQFYWKQSLGWNLLADIEADARMARILGSSAVATWISQSPVAGNIAAMCLGNLIGPAAERGVRLPIASSCAAYCESMVPAWLTAAENERIKSQRSQPSNPFFGAWMLRLSHPGVPPRLWRH